MRPIHPTRSLAAACMLALAVMQPLPSLAQHVDLGVDDSAEAEAPIQRRFLMEDSYGVVVTNEDLLGRFAMIYFGYTGCPDVCPTSLATIAEVMTLLGPEAEKVQPVFVTVDPDRDTAKLLQDYVGFFDKRIMALRGPKEYTDHMVKAFNARYEIHIPDPADPKAYSIDHTASIALLGPDGFLIRRFPHGTPADKIAEQIRADIAEAP